jgi:putative tryptophan/tyrosine transport system substrate-binding protein
VLAGKRLQLLRELVPAGAVIGLLVNPNNRASESEMRDAQAAAVALGLQILVAKATNERDFDAAFAAFIERRIGALMITNDPLYFSRREPLIALANRSGVPAVYFYREFAADGGLMSYAPSLPDAYRLAGVYTGRILKGGRALRLATSARCGPRASARRRF